MTDKTERALNLIISAMLEHAIATLELRGILLTLLKEPSISSELKEEMVPLLEQSFKRTDGLLKRLNEVSDVLKS
ncbi:MULTISPECIES: hypothetical protein [unclassified Bradyrhizobium]|uniref:hypothetical protein n=1 Tax=unclassified Bradyrhizobium TaxID=2631580 RepID=UPI0028EF0BC4|nr:MULTISPECIES: hypothetical protein [unclassified Bradyrhizobium]